MPEDSKRPAPLDTPPATEAATPRTTRLARAEQELRSRHQGARILIVEDDAFGREILFEYVTGAGLTADVAHDGVDALEWAARARYDLILMDIQMPRMDGLEATRRLRSQPPYADAPVIAVTAHAYVLAEELSRQAGMNAFLTKPVDPEVLYATLLEWLDRETDAGPPA